MHKSSFLLAGLAGLALAAGVPAAQAQNATSWGTKSTSYWSSDATGKYQPGQFVQAPAESATMPAATQAAPMMDQPKVKRARAQLRPRQQQPAMKPGMKAQPGEQPPADAKPAAPPTEGQGQPPAKQGTQPK